MNNDSWIQDAHYGKSNKQESYRSVIFRVAVEAGGLRPTQSLLGIETMAGRKFGESSAMIFTSHILLGDLRVKEFGCKIFASIQAERSQP